MSQKQRSKELQELIPPQKQQLNWQKLTESILLETLESFKKKTATKGVLSEEISC